MESHEDGPDGVAGDDETDPLSGGEASVSKSDPVEFCIRVAAARGGSQEELGRLFEDCRNYLLLIANLVVKRGLQPKVGASDLVQDTMAEASRIFDRFNGTTESELLGWLNGILENKIGNTLRRYYGTARRDARKELNWQQLFDSPFSEDDAFHYEESPSAICRSKEEWNLYQQALGELNPEDRELIRLRVDDDLSFDEVGLRMNRTADAARKAYARAVHRLQQRLDNYEQQHESE